MTPNAQTLYRIDASRTHEHVFEVRLTVPDPAPEVTLRLPVWIPGSYLVREFARHLFRIQAQQGLGRKARPVPITALDKASWQVACTGAGELVVTYQVYAFDPSVRAAFLGPSRGFFNATSLCLAVVGREHQAHRLELLPVPQPSWRVATALQAVRTDRAGFGIYAAASYDELADHPVELGAFWHGHFKALGVPHEWAVAGAGPRFDGERLLADSQRICEAAIRLWHPDAGVDGKRKGKREGKDQGPRQRPGEGAPFERYAFLLNVVDEGYGGLEHRASTALIASRRDLPRLNDRQGHKPPSEGYTTLLGLISHEYFHTWNVKRLKPREFVPYRFDRENYTELLWFFEGFTSYYDDLLLARAGLVDAPRYAKLLSKTVQNVDATPGRKLSSLAQASMDAWIKYYRPDENTPNATVSYYAKGALVALCLDLTLRREGRTTLDHVMRALWTRCAPADASGKGNDAAHIDRPMSEDDLREVLAELGARRFDAELDAWVHGTDELPLEPLLKHFGLALQHEPPTMAQRLGVRASENGGIQIKAVFSGGAAQAAGLAPGDELLAVAPLSPSPAMPKAKAKRQAGAAPAPAAWRLRRLDDWPLYSAVDDATVRAEVWVARDQQILRLPIRLPTVLGAPSVVVDPQADEAARKRQAAWLAGGLTG